MRLKHVKIQNFKGFAKKEFSLDENFTLFVGENGSGKTSALEAIACLLSPWLGDFSTNQEIAIESDFVRKSVYLQGSSLLIEEGMPMKLECQGTDGSHVETWWIKLKHSPPDQQRKAKAVRNAGSQIDLPRADGTPWSLLVFFRSGRAFGLREVRADWRDIMGGPQRREEGYADALSPKLAAKDLIEWLGAQEAITFQEGEEPSIYRAVKRAILSCLPDSQKLWFSAKYGEPVVQWRDGSIVAFSNLSDGQKGILALVGDIARRAALLNPQFGEEAAAKTPGVVLIDELDLHLHPRWQRRIVDDLKRVFPLVQFIATSHSPFIIQSLEPGELVCLDDDCQPIDYSRSSLEDIAEEVMGVEVPQRSKRFQEMLGAAEEYFRMVRAGETDSPELEKAREEFEALSEPFSNDPAMAAFLKLQREADSAKHQRREPAAATS